MQIGSAGHDKNLDFEGLLSDSCVLIILVINCFILLNELI